MRRATIAAVLAALTFGCGDDGSGGSTTGECRAAEDGQVTVMAKDIAWDVDCLRAPADEPLTIVVDNQDDGVNHNIHLTDAPGKPKTELEPGPVTQELEVTLPEGDYEYLCDIHPNMLGTLELVAEPADT